jgi:hypothetical protein
VDPCAVLTGGAASDLGAAGQMILSDAPAETLEGLPLVVDGDSPESCWVSVVTWFEQSLGLTL